MWKHLTNDQHFPTPLSENDLLYAVYEMSVGLGLLVSHVIVCEANKFIESMERTAERYEIKDKVLDTIMVDGVVVEGTDFG